MKYKIGLHVSIFTAFVWIFFNPGDALATQAHGAPEGIYAHQMAHILFILSMGFFIHWLRERKLIKEVGWRFIQYAAFFLILWNLDAFLVHLIDDQLGLIQVKRIGLWHIQLNAGKDGNILEILYYFAKLDHLFCVPALLFLYYGLRRLLKENHSTIAKQEDSRNV